jgi:hypothetical protein
MVCYLLFIFFLFYFKVCLGVVITPVYRISYTLGLSFQFGKWFVVFACSTSECYGEKDEKLISIESNQNCRDENKSNYVVAVHIEELLDLGQIKHNFLHWKAFTATIRSNVQYIQSWSLQSASVTISPTENNQALLLTTANLCRHHSVLATKTDKNKQVL